MKLKLVYALIFPMLLILLTVNPAIGEDEDPRQLCADYHLIEAVESIEDAKVRGTSQERISLLVDRLNEAIVRYVSPTKGISCFSNEESLQLIEHSKYLKLIADGSPSESNFFAENERFSMLLVVAGVVSGALLTTFSLEAAIEFRRIANMRSSG